MAFFNLRNFHETFVSCLSHETVAINMQKIVDVIASQFSIDFVHSCDKNPILLARGSKTCLIPTLNKCKIMFTLIYFDMRTCFDSHVRAKNKISNLICKI